MKVYRCLNKAEKELFEMNYICSRTGSEEERKVSLNTHDYGNVVTKTQEDKFKSERLHYFLFFEDAKHYFLEHQLSFYCIGEYEIPDDLVINNIGCGFYVDMNGTFVLETAIPYVDLIKDMDKDAYDLLVNGTLKCDATVLTRHIEKVYKIREKLTKNNLYVPLHLASCNYCKKIITEDIELNPYYKKFIEDYGIVEVLKALNIKIIMEGRLFDKFDIENKKVDLETLKNILKRYGLLNKEKTYSL